MCGTPYSIVAISCLCTSHAIFIGIVPYLPNEDEGVSHWVTFKIVIQEIFSLISE